MFSRLAKHLSVLAVLLAAFVAASCGVGAGESSDGVQLRVTSDFGKNVIADETDLKTSGEETVMRLLQRNVDGVKTRFGGAFVQEIEGVAGGERNGQSVDWLFYVNGFIADKGAASIKLHAGDRVWWDNHNWETTDRIPAVVGSFPEPFLSGIDGRKHPVRIECGTDEATCKDAQSQFTDLGVLASLGAVSRSFTKQTLRVLVGTWDEVGGDPFSAPIGKGPKASGVFARFTDNGRTLVTLDERGKEVRRLGPGTGLIAATAPPGIEEVQSGTVRKDPIWVVTGTDDAGVKAAIAALDEGALAGRFAAAIVGGKPVSLPEPAN